MEQYIFPFLLTLFARLSTAIGGAIAFHKKATSPKFLAFASLSAIYPEKQAYRYVTLVFFQV